MTGPHHPTRNLQRAAGDFEITGRDPTSPSEPMMIFFDQASDEIETEEQSKIAGIVSPLGQSLILNGFKSDDEKRSVARKRVRKVAEALKTADPTVNVTKKPKGGASRGQVDFRSRRVVEIIPAGGPSSIASCRRGAPNFLSDCPTSPHTVDDAVKEADSQLSQARNLLTAAEPAEDTLDQLSRFFGAAADANEIASKLGDIQNHINSNVAKAARRINRNKAGHICATACYTDCEGGTEALNNGIGAGALMILCPTWYADNDLPYKAVVLIHEGAHGTQGLGSGGEGAIDMAYEWEKVFEFLTTAESLDNADSYAFLVRLLTHPNGVTLGPALPDDVPRHMPMEQDRLREAVARLAKWLLQTSSQVENLFSDIKRARRRGWEPGFYEEIMWFMSWRFDLREPPKWPRKQDQMRVAAIADRYRQMAWAASEFVTILHGGSETKWEPGPGIRPHSPGHSVSVESKFLSLSQSEQIHLLLERIVEATPGISAALEPKYVEVAEYIRKKSGIGP